MDVVRKEGEKMKRISLKMTIALFFATFLILDFSGCGKNANGDIGTIIDSKLNTICNNPKVASSSNPYDYTKDSKEFEDIINMGNDALKYMLMKFKNSKENGLKEYVMAIACSKILKENPETKTWATGREWYNNYVKSNK